MSWFFNVVPYILALGTISLGAFEIIKDWKEYRSVVHPKKLDTWGRV
jgi:hypothetical protein